MNNLNESDSKLLEIIQEDIPLVSNPFSAIARKCNLEEEDAINRLKYFYSENIIREISAILSAEKLGYKSTLVAVSAHEKNMDKLVDKINIHPGVSHNYLRKNKYNIWFTLTIHKDMDFKHEIDKMFNNNNVLNYLILPSVKTFKIKVNFKLSDNNKKISWKKSNNIGTRQNKKKIILTDLDKQIIMNLQQNLMIKKEPWKELWESLDISEQQLFDSVERLKDSGVIKRIAGVLRHRKVGFNFNGMICFDIPLNEVSETGRKLAGYKEITHCYQRQICPEWNYSVYAMIHAKTEEQCNALIRKIAGEVGCKDYITLFSTKEFKKERVKYFL